MQNPDVVETAAVKASRTNNLSSTSDVRRFVSATCLRMYQQSNMPVFNWPDRRTMTYGNSARTIASRPHSSRWSPKHPCLAAKADRIGQRKRFSERLMFRGKEKPSIEECITLFSSAENILRGACRGKCRTSLRAVRRLSTIAIELSSNGSNLRDDSTRASGPRTAGRFELGGELTVGTVTIRVYPDVTAYFGRNRGKGECS